MGQDRHTDKEIPDLQGHSVEFGFRNTSYYSLSREIELILCTDNDEALDIAGMFK